MLLMKEVNNDLDRNNVILVYYFVVSNVNMLGYDGWSYCINRPLHRRQGGEMILLKMFSDWLDGFDLHPDDRDIIFILTFSSVGGIFMVLLIHSIGEVINAIH
jgi:hypothetical protein